MVKFLRVWPILTILFLCSCNKSVTTDKFGIQEGSGTGSAGIAGSIAALSASSFTLLPNSTSTFSVVVADASGMPIAGKTVNFVIGSAGQGALSATTGTTDTQGMASVLYTAPATLGSYNIVATSAYGSVSVTAVVDDGITTPSYPVINFVGLDHLTVVNDSSIKVFFSRPSGGSGFFTYRLYRDNIYSAPFKTYGIFDPIDSALGTYFEVTGLTPSTSYNFTLRAYDLTQGLEDSNVVTATASTMAAMTPFAGVSSVDQITTSNARINWTHISDAISYKIYNMTSGSPVLAGIVSAPTPTFTVSGLSPSTGYTFRVKYVNASNIEDSNTTNGAFTTSGPLTFGGLSSITNVSATSMQLNWTHVTGAVNYRVDDMSTGSPVLVGLVSGPLNYKVVNGLSLNTSYSFRVRALNNFGVEDTNNVLITQATPSVTLIHAGWTDIYSVGRKVSFNTSVIDDGAQRLEWNDMTSSGAISSYNLYRSTSGLGPWTKVNPAPIATNSGLPISYTIPDVNTLTPSVAYYYQVRAVVGASEIIPASTTPIDHSIVRMIFPPDNMSLVHRWIANEEMCDKIGRGLGDSGGADVANHYRCPYNGLGSTKDLTDNNYYYDLGYDMLFDSFELGCNFSRTTCPSHGDGTTTTTDCIGNLTSMPTWSVSNSNVAYTRQHDGSYSNSCHIRKSGVWVPTYNLIATTEVAPVSDGGSGLGGILASNAAHLPPLRHKSQQQLQAVCQNFSVSINDNGTSLTSKKRIPRRKEILPAKAWPKNFNLTTMDSIANGAHTNGCGKGGSITNLDLNNDFYPSATGFLVRTGSATTSACKSRYGIQDLIGSVSEWLADQINCTGTSCSHDVTNTLDPISKFDWKGEDNVYLDYKNAVNKFAEYDPGPRWTNETVTDYFNPMMGIPLECSGSNCTSGTDDNILVTGKTSGASIINFFTNQEVYIYDFNSAIAGLPNVRGMVHDNGMNSWYTSRWNYTLSSAAFNATNTTGTGGRCMAPVVY